MERTALEVQWAPGHEAGSALSGAQRAEVLRSLGVGVREQLDDQTTQLASPDSDVQEHKWVGRVGGGGHD